MYSVGGGAVGSALGSLGAGATSAGAEKSGTIMVQLYPASGANWFKRDQNNGTKVETGIGDQYFLKGVGRAGSTQSGGISVLKGDTAVGILGAFIGGFLAAVFHVGIAIVGHPLITQMIIAFIGAAILLLIVRVLGGGRARRRAAS